MDPTGVKDSNEAKLIGIRRALAFWANYGMSIEGYSANAIKCARGSKIPPWKLLSVVRENNALVLTVDVFFQHVRSVNGVADFLAKLGLERDHECGFS